MNRREFDNSMHIVKGAIYLSSCSYLIYFIYDAIFGQTAIRTVLRGIVVERTCGAIIIILIDLKDNNIKSTKS